MRKIRFYYDIVCPYSYMESRTVEAAEDAITLFRLDTPHDETDRASDDSLPLPGATA